MERSELVIDIIKFTSEEDQLECSRCTKKVRKIFERSRMNSADQLLISCDEDIFAIESSKKGSWIDFSYDQLHRLESYCPNEIIVVGLDYFCRKFIENCPVEWLHSIFWVEIHLTDKDENPTTSLYWREKIKNRLYQMESLTNIVIGNNCFGANTITIEEDETTSYDEAIKLFVVFGANLKPTMRDVFEIREKANIADEFEIISNRRFSVFDDVDVWLRGLGAEEDDEIETLVLQVDDKRSISLTDYDDNPTSDIEFLLGCMVAILILYLFSYFWKPMFCDLCAILGGLILLPLYIIARQEQKTANFFESNF